MTVSHVYKISGYGTVVVGRPLTGSLNVGKEVIAASLKFKPQLVDSI